MVEGIGQSIAEGIISMIILAIIGMAVCFGLGIGVGWLIWG